MASILLGVLTARECEQSVQLVRRNLRYEINLMAIPDDLFLKHFRLSEGAFQYVLGEIEKSFPPKRSSALCPEEKLAVTLRFLAEGNYQHGTGQDFNIAIGQSIFSKVLNECLKVMEQKQCAKWITLRMTDEEKRHAKIYFYEKSQIPGIVMCVDGTHIKIIPPAVNRNLYYSQKGYYSLNALIICDHNQAIRFIDASYQGSNHNSHIGRVSSARRFFFEDLHTNGDTNTKILGGAGYPAEPWLVTPFRASEEGTFENDFNMRHSAGRNIIEKTIGISKNRFHCIIGAIQLHYTPAKAASMVNVACAMQNICLQYIN